MGDQLYYNNAADVIPLPPAYFASVTNGIATDPGSVSCIVTGPEGGITTYSYSDGNSGMNEVVKKSVGAYGLSLTGLTVAGLYAFTWVGSGNGVQSVQPGTFRVLPLTGVSPAAMTTWYCGMEELKSRLGITDDNDDYEMQLAIQTVTNWITEYCGQHFYQMQDTRTFAPANIWLLDVDPLVSVSGLNIDYDGDGVFETSWTQNVQYQLRLGREQYNVNAAGVARPYKQIQVLMGEPGVVSGGEFFPFIWPFTHLDRVQIIGTWGWPAIPPNVSQAALMLSADLFKSKDAPWGVAGMGDLGIVKVQSNPWVVELLRPYINVHRKVGV